MNSAMRLLVLMACLSLTSESLLAQDWDYHPDISDNFTLSVGAFRSSNSFKVEAKGNIGDLGDEIDFENALGVDDVSTLVNAKLRWKFGSTRKWSLWGQYFSNNATGTSTLERDYEWDGNTFRQGSYAEAGVKLSVARVFLGRSFVLNDQHDFGVGIGIHKLDLSAYVEAEVLFNDESTGVRRADVGADGILPNIGTWYNFSPAKRWLLHTRFDWISANIGDYDGTLWNVTAGVSFQAWRHVGFDLSWQYFNLDVNVDKTDWAGGAKLTYNGPVIGVTVNW